MSLYLNLLLAGLSAGPLLASMQPFRQVGDQTVYLLHSNTGSFLCDQSGSPLLGSNAASYQYWQGGYGGLSPLALEEPYHFANSLEGPELQPSSVVFPDAGWPSNSELLLELRETRLNDAIPVDPVLPLQGQIELCLIPIQLYAELPDSVLWEDEAFYEFDGLTTERVDIYNHVFGEGAELHPPSLYSQ